MELLLLNIKELVQTGEKPCAYLSGKAMSSLNTIQNAFLLISEERILDYGSMESLNDCDFEGFDLLMEIDCKGKLVFPSFCDPDSHLLYPFTQLHDHVGHPAGIHPGSGFTDSFVRLHEMTN